MSLLWDYLEKSSLVGTELFLFQIGQVRSFIISIPVHLLNGRRCHIPHIRCLRLGVGLFSGKVGYLLCQTRLFPTTGLQSLLEPERCNILSKVPLSGRQLRCWKICPVSSAFIPQKWLPHSFITSSSLHLGGRRDPGSRAVDGILTKLSWACCPSIGWPRSPFSVKFNPLFFCLCYPETKWRGCWVRDPLLQSGICRSPGAEHDLFQSPAVAVWPY